jgi:hypothetical protein
MLEEVHNVQCCVNGTYTKHTCVHIPLTGLQNHDLNVSCGVFDWKVMHTLAYGDFRTSCGIRSAGWRTLSLLVARLLPLRAATIDRSQDSNLKRAVLKAMDVDMMTERTAIIRLFSAVCLLVLFEIALLLDNAGIVFWGGVAIATVIGVLARRWWVVPLIPTALIILLNIHVRLFGEIVRLPPEYGWEVEFAPFAFAVSLWFASLFAALFGAVIGYVATMDRWHLRAYGLPALLLTLPILGVFWLDELGAVMLFAIAFAIGSVMRPARLWGIWLGAIVVWWLASGVYSMFGDLVEKTPIDYMIESIPFTALLVLLPMSLGRWVRGIHGSWRRGQQEIGQA